MDVTEYNILNRRKQFKKRRNIIRRVFLFILIISFFSSLYFLWNYPLCRNPKLIIKNNFLLSTNYLEKFLNDKMSNKNFYFINSRSVSVSLSESVPLVKTIIIRKYLFPDYKFVVYLIEKKLWAKVTFSDIGQDSFSSCYLAEDGCLIFDDYLNKDKLTSDFIKVYFPKKFASDRTKLKHLFKVSKCFSKNLDFPLSALYLKDNLDVSVFSKFGFQLKCGKLDESIKDRVLKLRNIPQVLDLLRTGEYKSGYLDLNLDRAAIIKVNDAIRKDPSNTKENKRSIFSIFKNSML